MMHPVLAAHWRAGRSREREHQDDDAADARDQSEPIMNRSSSSSLARSRVIRKWSRFR
jgi:hypothetical protein